MENEVIQTKTGVDNTNRISLQTDINGVFSYALYQNHVSILRSVAIKNLTDEEVGKLRLHVESDTEFIKPFDMAVDKIDPNEESYIKKIPLQVNRGFLISLTERTSTFLQVMIYSGDELLAEHAEELVVYAYDQWPGLNYHLDLLAAFVTPNHPVVKELMVETAELMGKWSKIPSLDGYQSKDPERVALMAAAVYTVIQNKNIIYSESPASFADSNVGDYHQGQRVRLADEVMSKRMGTCLDMSLLYVSVIEAIGLNPFLVLLEGHVFAGVWLIDELFSDKCVDDPSQIEKRIADGINELVVVECTAMCKGYGIEFTDAVKAAVSSLPGDVKFQSIVDIKRARLGKVQPIPQRVNITEIEDENKDDTAEITDVKKPEIDISTIDVSLDGGSVMTKQMQWERKLLDLSAKNALINMKIRSVLPVLVNNVARLEDALSDGCEYSIISRPVEWDLHNITMANFESVNDLGPYAKVIDEGMEHHKLHSWCSESELNKSLTKLYRASKVSIEENGASTLYMTLGLLRWTEGVKNIKSYYAPILLVPVELVRKSALQGYVIKKRDDDIQINVTLLEFLKQNYDITIGGLDSLPLDEHGVDVDKIFTIMRKAVMDRKNWNVIENVFVGSFSFTQFLMWNDIHSHSEDLEKNRIVHALINGEIYSSDIDETVSENETFLPVSVDASQLRAINLAAKGESFVLHGPPGTGKSQTITAMIANAITKGKTVLFVAEKMAALEVVQKRLNAMGIGDFCLELHSNKAVKKNVLNALQKIVDLKVWGMATDYEKKLSEIDSVRKELDGYVKALYKERSFGLSLKEMIDFYEILPECGQRLRFDREWIKGLTLDDIENHKALLERLVKSKREAGTIDKKIFDAIGITEYSQSFREDLEDVLDEYKKALDDYEKADIERLSSITFGFLPSKCSLVTNYIDHKKEFSKRRESMLSKWSEDFLGQNMNVYYEKYAEAEKRLIGKQKRIDEITAEIQLKAHFQVLYETVRTDLEEISVYQRDLNSFLAFEAGLPAEIREYAAGGGTAEAVSTAKTLRDNIDKKEQELEDILILQDSLFEPFDLTRKKEIWRVLSDNTRYFRDWFAYKKILEECDQAGLMPVYELYHEDMQAEELVNTYLKLAYKAIIRSVVESEPTLDHFNGNDFNDRITAYKKIDEKFTELTKEEIYYRLTHQLPTGHESAVISRELALLKKAIQSGGRNMSLRMLFEQIPHILVKLCPCLLMSPISVSQYLSADSDLFDIVIFDEASQLPTCKAVGVLARGKSAVIVGDPNQMPPTSFFATNVADDENIALEDLDSILEDCLAIGMPECHLQWHYRSKHESLIAFSNREYYENKMLTFPSVNDRERRVKLVTVNGRFDRKKGRVNEREGKKIVEEVLRRYHDEKLKKYSIGIVTFNIGQQGLIEDLLAEEYRKDAEFDAWANEADEPLFVKNLENVQGDERDIIIFSVSFGQDESGKLSLNFGPLNREGGWKRLNVAVSRARKEMLVFSSMTPEMIDLNRTKSKGVEGLKDFLEYARDGRLVGDTYNEDKELRRGIQKEICDALKEAGYVFKKDLGHSDFRIDIAVNDPYDKDGYVLGILLDGEYYKKSSDNTRDRELSQPGILKGLGWNIFRIWTLDWWDDKERTIQKLLSVLEEEMQKAKDRAENKQKKDPGPESEEIVINETDEDEKKTKIQKKENIEGNNSFETYERFTSRKEIIETLNKNRPEE